MTILHPQPAPLAPDQAPPPPLPRRDPITQLPILILFPHSRCNCRCLMCDIWRATTRDELAADDVAGWLAEWRALGVRRVVLSGGEALLHAQLWQLCDHLRGAGMGITILSTGLLLRRHAAELVRRCDDVVVSLDGPQPIHDSIRNVPRAYARLAEGVAAVKAADPRVSVSARCTVQRNNFPHLRAAWSRPRTRSGSTGSAFWRLMSAAKPSTGRAAGTTRAPGSGARAGRPAAASGGAGRAQPNMPLISASAISPSRR
ncbi:MAG: radical SAM protein [Kouleothrix sp.]